MSDNIPIVYVTSKGITQFSGYFCRVKKEMHLIGRDDGWEVSLVVLYARNAHNKRYFSRIRREITERAHFIWIYDVITLRRSLKNKAIIHAQGHRAFFTCWLASRFLSVKPKLLFDYHGAGAEENRLLGGSRATAALVRLWEKLGMWKSHAIILVSESHREELVVQHGISRDKIVIIRNFVATERSALINGKLKLRERLELPLGKVLAIYSGNFQPWQEPELLSFFAEYIAQYSERIQFVVISNDTRAKAYIKNSRTILRGANGSEVFEYLRAADAGLLLRRPTLLNRVADPTKLGEYLYCGVTILASGIDDLQRMLKHTPEAGYFYEGSFDCPEQIVRDLADYLATLPIGKFNRYSHALYQQYYSADVSREKLRQCYASLTNVRV